MSAGKGDKPRKVNGEIYRSNFDRIFKKERSGDWPEDFPLENGNYNNQCCECGRIFIGYKRRVVCKICAN